jgi:hypothetical protein
MANRKDEEPKTWFRSNRVFRVDGNWFIHTREGIAVGPYNDKFAADVDAEMLKSLLVGVGEVEAHDIIREFMENGAHNLGRAGHAEPEVDADEVASLLDDDLLDDEEWSLDQVRQLS